MVQATVNYHVTKPWVTFISKTGKYDRGNFDSYTILSSKINFTSEFSIIQKIYSIYSKINAFISKLELFSFKKCLIFKDRCILREMVEI